MKLLIELDSTNCSYPRMLLSHKRVKKTKLFSITSSLKITLTGRYVLLKYGNPLKLYNSLNFFYPPLTLSVLKCCWTSFSLNPRIINAPTPLFWLVVQVLLRLHLFSYIAISLILKRCFSSVPTSHLLPVLLCSNLPLKLNATSRLVRNLLLPETRWWLSLLMIWVCPSLTSGVIKLLLKLFVNSLKLVVSTC